MPHTTVTTTEPAYYGIWVTGFCWLDADGRTCHDPIWPFESRADAERMAQQVMWNSAAKYTILGPSTTKRLPQKIPS